MDLWAVYVKNSTQTPLLLRNSFPKKPISSCLRRRANPSCRVEDCGVFEIRVLRRRRACSSSLVVRAMAKKNHDNSGNGDRSIPEGDGLKKNNSSDGNKSNDTASNKSQHLKLDWREFRANLFAREQAEKVEGDAHNEGVKPHESKSLDLKWAHPIPVPETGCVLVATEKLDGVRTFERTVVLLLRSGTRHPQEGPFGVVINRPLHKKIKHMKPTNLDLATTFSDCSLHFGGPLEASMFLLKTGEKPKIPGFEEVIPGLCFGARNSLDEAAGGHPVCYNAYGLFRDKDMYDRIFGDEEKLHKFLRWRVQVLERGIKLLHFKPGGVNSMIQVTDLKDMPKRELRVASNHILSLFQDNYPEMVARKIFINVPWYFSVLYSMFSPFLTQRTKSKFVISKEGNVAETLYKFIRPEDVPAQYGGLSRPSDLQNGPPKPASEFTVKGGEKVNIQIEGIEAGATITWDIVVGGWELEYSAEFVPSSEGSYTIAVEKPRKMAASEEAIHNSFTSREAGKMVLSVDNTASRRKKVAAYRYIVRKSTAIVPSNFNYA